MFNGLHNMIVGVSAHSNKEVRGEARCYEIESESTARAELIIKGVSNQADAFATSASSGIGDAPIVLFTESLGLA